MKYNLYKNKKKKSVCELPYNNYSDPEESIEEDKLEVMTTTAAINDPNENLDVKAVFMDISNMLNTSKNYTPRDKQEIIAQKDFSI